MAVLECEYDMNTSYALDDKGAGDVGSAVFEVSLVLA